MISLYGSHNVELDHLTVFGGFPALLVNASRNIRVRHSAFRGLAAPWTSRAHMKYRGTPSYQIVLQNNQPINENIEFAWCEFTDDHDGAFLRFVKNLQLHHSLVDNFNDDGLECGPKLRDHTIYIHENRIGATPRRLQQHEIDKDESPLDQCGRFRSVCFPQRVRFGGWRSGPPVMLIRTGAFLHAEGHLGGDHGSPTWPVMGFYHNTILRRIAATSQRSASLAWVSLARTTGNVFNNIFVQMDGIPGVKFIALPHAQKNCEKGGTCSGACQGRRQMADKASGKVSRSPLIRRKPQVLPAGLDDGRPLSPIQISQRSSPMRPRQPTFAYTRRALPRGPDWCSLAMA